MQLYLAILRSCQCFTDFGGYINASFSTVADALDMQPKDVHRIVSNSFVASFITDEQRKQWLGEVDRVYEEVTGEKP